MLASLRPPGCVSVLLERVSEEVLRQTPWHSAPEAQEHVRCHEELRCLLSRAWSVSQLCVQPLASCSPGSLCLLHERTHWLYPTHHVLCCLNMLAERCPGDIDCCTHLLAVMQCLSVEMKLRYLRERKQGGQGDARHLIRLEQELLNLANIKVLCSFFV